MFFWGFIIAFLGISFFIGAPLSQKTDTEKEIIFSDATTQIHSSSEDTTQQSKNTVDKEGENLIQEDVEETVLSSTMQETSNPEDITKPSKEESKLEETQIHSDEEIRAIDRTLVDDTAKPSEIVLEENTYQLSEVLPKEEKQDMITLSVSCQTLLNHLDTLNPNVVELIPKDGIILPPTLAKIEESDSAFDVLKRELLNRKIHMEFNYTPVYRSMYIEGIANIYEFDGGELSGWMYRVNGVAPNTASSSYLVKPRRCGGIFVFL